MRERSGRTTKSQIEASQTMGRGNDFDLILLTVKSYDTQSASLQLNRSPANKTPILSLQNGLGNIEILQRHLKGRHLLAGSTTEAALGIGPGHVVHTGKGMTWIGEPGGRLTLRSVAIGKAIRDAGFEMVVSRNIQGILWSKAIVNSAINPITALARVRNGELLRNPNLREAATRVVSEGAAVAIARGVVLRPRPASLLRKIIASTSNNRSSMLQDIEAGRKTEIWEINGRISMLGRSIRVPAPLNELLTMLIDGQSSS